MTHSVGIYLYVYYELLKFILRNPSGRAATMPSRMKMTSCHHHPDQEGVWGSSAPGVGTHCMSQHDLKVASPILSYYVWQCNPNPIGLGFANICRVKNLITLKTD